MSRPAPRWGFRARLAALITGVFLAGGILLLGALTSIVREELTTFAGAFDECAVGHGIQGPCGQLNFEGVVDVPPAAVKELRARVVGTTEGLTEAALTDILRQALVVLVLFAAAAALAAWWLSQRPLARIARVTRAARVIASNDLGRRLDLPGPADEVKELGDTIDGMLERLQDAFERQDRFIAGASHELRTPLTTTRTLLEFPLEQGRVPAELQPAIRAALAANARSERIIAALLTLARSTHGPAGSGAAADLALVGRTVLSANLEAAEARGVSIAASLVPVTVHADAALTEVAIGNLVENAIRHNHDGGRVAMAIATADGGARVTVENTGRELTAAEVARLTEPFHRGAETRLSVPGTGLGLTLVDTIARACGGTLEIEPRPGGGLTATLTLP